MVIKPYPPVTKTANNKVGEERRDIKEKIQLYMAWLQKQIYTGIKQTRKTDSVSLYVYK